MSELLPHGEPWRLLNDLQQRVAERAPAEGEILGELAARSRATEKRYQRLQKTLAARHAESRTAEELAHASAHTVILQQYQADYDDVKRQWNSVCAEIASRYEVEHDQGQDALQEARWQAGTMFEAGKGTLGEQVKEIEIRQDAQWQVFDAIR